jgi:hypothetical protein
MLNQPSVITAFPRRRMAPGRYAAFAASAETSKAKTLTRPPILTRAFAAGSNTERLQEQWRRKKRPKRRLLSKAARRHSTLSASRRDGGPPIPMQKADLAAPHTFSAGGKRRCRARQGALLRQRPKGAGAHARAPALDEPPREEGALGQAA